MALPHHLRFRKTPLPRSVPDPRPLNPWEAAGQQEVLKASDSQRYEMGTIQPNHLPDGLERGGLWVQFSSQPRVMLVLGVPVSPRAAGPSPCLADHAKPTFLSPPSLSLQFALLGEVG